jgi:hypothetical protein
MECKSFVNIEIRPTDDAVRLLRLILSFASDCLDFDLDEIDELKVAITEIIGYLRSYLSDDVLVRFSLLLDDDVLRTEIFAPISPESFSLDERSPMFVLARSLLDELEFNEREDGVFSIRMAKQKRNSDE